MSNIYDYAYELERSIRETAEYKRLKQAVQQVKSDPNASRLFDGFKRLQIRLQEKSMRGEPISRDETQQIQQQMQIAQTNPLIAQLMMAEQRLGALLNDVNKIMSKPLEELYGK
ncbi:YlbF family regulator [Tuberibacillus calidus]|uniref:YlbF family regulator n=1 Tax=Tuberibacillus calidus TaxID=340097 RepID=UPI000418A702|nr:YlbF family regulator [Tuberibacillus calidus]